MNGRVVFASWVMFAGCGNNDEVDALTTQVAVLEAGLADLEDRMDQTEADVLAAGQVDLGTLATDVDDLGTRMTAAEADLTTANAERDALGSELVTLEGRLTTAESDIAAVEGSVATLTTDLGSTTTRVTDLEDAAGNDWWTHSGAGSTPSSSWAGVSGGSAFITVAKPGPLLIQTSVYLRDAEARVVVTGSGFSATSPEAQSPSINPGGTSSFAYIANIPGPGSYTVALEGLSSGISASLRDVEMSIVQLAEAP